MKVFPYTYSTNEAKIFVLQKLNPAFIDAIIGQAKFTHPELGCDIIRMLALSDSTVMVVVLEGCFL